MNRVAFITGICGQDGSYLAEQLIAEGTTVHGLAHSLETPPKHLPADVTVHTGDLRDITRMQALLTEITPDEIYNLAAISSVAACWSDPVACADINGRAVAVLLDQALRLQEHLGREVRLVQASSAAMYGEPDVSPQTELTPLRPISPYGAAKAYAHFLLSAYRDRGLHASGMILFNHESPRRPTSFVTRKITTAVAAIANGSIDPLRLGNQASVRDWGWAPDYVRAMRLAAQADEADDYVVATGEGHTVAEFLDAAFAAAGIDDPSAYVRTDQALFMPNDPTALVGDASKIASALGWKPTKTFTEIVTAMVKADLDQG